MISPINIATDGYLCKPISIATSGYICLVGFDLNPCNKLYDVTHYADLGYDMHEVIVVKPTDIIVRQNGAGFDLSYYGNGQLYNVGLNSISGAGKTKEIIICEFVSFLNNLPIKKDKKFQRKPRSKYHRK